MERKAVMKPLPTVLIAVQGKQKILRACIDWALPWLPEMEPKVWGAGLRPRSLPVEGDICVNSK